MEVNFGKTAKGYAEYRAGFPESFFERLRNYNVGLPEQTIASRVEEFDKEQNILLNQYFPKDSLAIPHRVFAIIADKG